MPVSDSSDADAGEGAADAGSPSLGTPIRLLQLTDLHLFSDPAGRLLGQDTRETLARVLELAHERHWPPDALVLTGDLVHDERIEGYRLLHALLSALGLPFWCIPGNHDRADLLTAYLDPGARAALRLTALGPWDLALLDSTIPFEDGGHLAPEVIDGLDRHLAAHPARPMLVCLHHQPLPMGSRWIDTMMVDNGDALLTLADRHANLRCILWGHVHQSFSARRGHALLLASPSTSVQFLPGSADFAMDPLPPGYRWLVLHPNGRIETGVERIDGYPEPLVKHSTGY